MPIYRQIDDFSPRDTYTLIRDIDPLDNGGTVTDAWLTVKKNVTDNDSMAKINMTISVSGLSQGTINNYPDGSSQITFIFTPSLGLELLPRETYYYDINIKTSINEFYTVEEGKFFTTYFIRNLIP
jgi:hypothetical protein